MPCKTDVILNFSNNDELTTETPNKIVGIRLSDTLLTFRYLPNMFRLIINIKSCSGTKLNISIKITPYINYTGGGKFLL